MSSSSLILALVVISIAWAITLAMLMFGRSGATATAELQAKFRDCATRALSPERVESVLTAVQALETMPDVSALARLLGHRA